MTNLSLDKLREASGAFITESDFQVIELQYLDGLKNHNLTDSEGLAEQTICNDLQFVVSWIYLYTIN